MGLDVVTMGECMVQMNAVQTGPIRSVTLFEKHAAGAESNVAVGMVRMGHTAGWLSRVGDDEFGKYILTVLRGEGVDVSRVKVDAEAPTGLYFIQRWYPVPEKSIISYYRKGSAASRICPDDVDSDYIKGAKVFHVTGITPALSDSCREATWKALEVARKGKVKVSFDTNIRLKLWPAEKARETLLPMIEIVDYLFIDQNDAKILVSEEEPRKIGEKLLRIGPSIVIVKLGEEGAAAMTERDYFQKPGFIVPIVDVIGAGDAFAAGILSCIFRGIPLDRALEIGNAAGALVVTVRGDIEAVPSWQDIQIFLSQHKKLRFSNIKKP